MAKKKTLDPVKPIEPESNSSDYETDASSDEEEPPKTTLKPDSSESESDPEPIPDPSTTFTLSKRPAASEPTKSENAKKLKTNSDSSKRALFQRLFSEEDEIVILNGMIEFETKEKKSPIADIDAFFEFIKNQLHVDVSKKQLQRKIMKLRKRYENSKGKAMSSVKPFYDRADKLWGNGNGNGNGNGGGGGGGGEEEKVKEAGVSSVSNSKNCVVGKEIGSYFGLSDEEKLIRMGMELFGGEEKIAGWEEWKKLEKEGMELTIKQLDVKRAKMRLVLDTME